ncbi:MAG: DUF2798 domain-containing protein [Negativicutes bacterium]|nr:DUF2798 domain-containing protein [Negativicutes bacterium]
MSLKQEIISKIAAAFVLSLCMSLILTVINIGFSESLVKIWLRTWLTAFTIVTPLTFLIPGFINKIVTKYIC